MIKDLKELKSILYVETDEELDKLFKDLVGGPVDLNIFESHGFQCLNFSIQTDKEELKSFSLTFPLAFYRVEEALFDLINQLIRKGLTEHRFGDKNKLKKLIDFSGE